MGVSVRVGFNNSVGVQSAEKFPSGAFGTHGLQRLVPLTTSQRPLGLGGGGVVRSPRGALGSAKFWDFSVALARASRWSVCSAGRPATHTSSHCSSASSFAQSWLGYNSMGPMATLWGQWRACKSEVILGCTCMMLAPCSMYPSGHAVWYLG